MLAFYKKPLFAAFLFILSLSLLPGARRSRVEARLRSRAR